MTFKHMRIFVVLVTLGLLVIAASSAAAKEEQKGPFTLTALTAGDTDTFEIIISDDYEDDAKLEIKLEIEESEGDWELELEGPNGEDFGSLSSDAGKDEFKLEIKGEVQAGTYIFTFTNTGTELAQISGEYKIELKDEDRFFYDPGAKIALYVIQIDVTYIINIYGIDADSEGYEAISVTLDELYVIIRQRLNLSVNFVIDLDELEIEENILLASSDDGKVQLYLLTTGEFQINVGPFEDGTVQVFVYDNFPPTRVYRKDFNVYTVLESLAAQSEED